MISKMMSSCGAPRANVVQDQTAIELSVSGLWKTDCLIAQFGGCARASVSVWWTLKARPVNVPYARDGLYPD